MAELPLALKVAPNGAAVTPLVPPAQAPLISHQQLQRLYELMLQYQLADSALQQAFRRKKWDVKDLPQLQFPAVCAGLFKNLREGDNVGATSYAFAANLAADLPLPDALQNVTAIAETEKPSRRSTRLHQAEQLAAVTGAALAHAGQADSNVVIAFPPTESWHKDKSSASVLRWAGEQHLPVVYVTFARDLPRPGHSQSAFGLPQISVDANDVVAVYRVAQECVHRARTGIGPSWIQCVAPAGSISPLAVMQKFLEARKLFDPSRKAAATKLWREHWKQSWQAALEQPREHRQPPPIVSFDASN